MFPLFSLRSNKLTSSLILQLLIYFTNYSYFLQLIVSCQVVNFKTIIDAHTKNDTIVSSKKNVILVQMDKIKT